MRLNDSLNTEEMQPTIVRTKSVYTLLFLDRFNYFFNILKYVFYSKWPTIKLYYI